MNGDNNKKRVGFFIGLLFAICDKLCAVFASGFLFGIFASGSSAREDYESSLTYNFFKKLNSKTRKITSRIKTAAARQFETSMILRIISLSLNRILDLPARIFGSFMLTWSAYAVLIEMIKRFVLFDTDRSAASLVSGIVVFVSSLPFLFSDRSICTLAFESPMVSSVLTRIVGVPEETLKAKRSVYRAQSGAVILGIVLGVLTYFIEPVYMVIGFAVLVAVSLIMLYPECGVIASLAFAPIMGILPAPSITLAALVLLTALAYTVKVIRGKRVFKFGICELTVYCFIAIVLAGGFAPGESNTMQNALLTFSLMLIFPLTVNLMKYKHWIKTAIAALAIPATIVAFIGIAEYALGFSPSGWVDMELFGSITARAVSLFGNPNMLGSYLVAVFPISLMFTLPIYNIRVRMLGGISSAFIAVCTLLTFSRAAWVALLFGGLLFAVTVTPRGILWVIPAVSAGAVAFIAFPDTIGARVINFFSMADSANSYRVSVWNSSWELFSNVFSGGVGLGEEAFKTAYALYAEAGTNTVMHSHSLYLQIGISLGLVGLISFILSVFAVLRKAVTASVESDADKDLGFSVKAAVSGAAALMCAGVFDYTWYNFRIMFVFWALMGLACAAVNINERNYVAALISENDDNFAYISVAIPASPPVAAKKEKEVNEND